MARAGDGHRYLPLLHLHDQHEGAQRDLHIAKIYHVLGKKELPQDKGALCSTSSRSAPSAARNCCLPPHPVYLTLARGPVLSKLSLESGPSLEDFRASE